MTLVASWDLWEKKHSQDKNPSIMPIFDILLPDKYKILICFGKHRDLWISV